MKRGLLVVLLTCSAVLLAACGLSFQNLPVGRDEGGGAYRLTIVFTDAVNLPVGGKVVLGQRQVGRVSSLRAKDFQAEVTVSIDPGVRLGKGTTARLEVTSALGEEYVSLRPPATPAGGDLADGATIGVGDTSAGPSVEDLLSALGTMVNGAGLDQARTVVTETNAMLAGREGTVRDLFGRLDGLLAGLDAHRDELNRGLDAVNRLAATVDADRGTLDAALTRITPALRTLAGERGDFEQLLGQVTSLSRTVTGVLGKTENSLVDIAGQVRPVLDEVSGMDTQLGQALSAIKPFSAGLGRAIPGDYLDLDGTIDVPGTLLSLLTGAPLPTGPEPAPTGLFDFLTKGLR